MMNKVHAHIDKFCLDEEGQGTLEYVLLISVLIAVIIGVGITFRDKLEQLMQGKVAKWVEDRIFNPSTMHRFPFNFKK